MKCFVPSTTFAFLGLVNIGSSQAQQSLRGLQQGNSNPDLGAVFGQSGGNGIGNGRENGQGNAIMKKPCTLLQRVVDYEGKGSEEFFWDCALDAEAIGPGNGTFVNIEGIDIQAYRPNSGESTFFAPGIRLANGKARVPEHANPVFDRLTDTNEFVEDAKPGKTRRRLDTGEKTLLVLRVLSNDSINTQSAQEISDGVFGTYGDAVTLKSQYAACSNDQLHFEPASHAQTTESGVYEAYIDMNVIGADDEDVTNAAVASAASVMGNLNQFDHVMVCVPPGTGSWVAWAYINHWLSVYNDDWCTSPSAGMHELGHNMNLGHSGESSIYDDQTGMMGYSYPNKDVSSNHTAVLATATIVVLPCHPSNPDVSTLLRITVDNFFLAGL